MRLISDFDGVIADLSERYYQVYRWSLTQIAPDDQAITVLSKDEFWQLKRQQTPREIIGQKSGLTDKQIPQFIELRNDNAHNLANMVHDRLIDGSLEALQMAKDLGWEIMTVTMRRTSELAEMFKLYPELGQVIPGDRRFTMPDAAERDRDLELKPLLLAETLITLPQDSQTWMVGDTEADIRAAQSQNIPVISVLSGIRDRQILEEYKPDFFADNLLAAVKLIQSAQ
ncbi:MAG: HAD family hydrolase [Limnothrix sp. RL_2_0]|nr:HAD family hydrolase [Limnothrix sp. RL_2_0]